MTQEELNKLIQIWIKGIIVPGYDSNIWRKDAYGTFMKWSDYGNRNSNYGWEVDHIIPVDKGGSDNTNNLRPLNWNNNVIKSNKII